MFVLEALAFGAFTISLFAVLAFTLAGSCWLGDKLNDRWGAQLGFIVGIWILVSVGFLLRNV